MGCTLELQIAGEYNAKIPVVNVYFVMRICSAFAVTSKVEAAQGGDSST